MIEENRRFWTVFNVFTAVNGGLLVFCAPDSPAPAVKCAISVVGGVICFVWRQIQARLGFWTSWWEKKTEKIETHYLTEFHAERTAKGLTLPDDIQVFCGRKPQSREKGKPRWPGMSTTHAGTLLPMLFMLGWTLIFYITLRPRLSVFELVVRFIK